jgi:hypothetical protein
MDADKGAAMIAAAALRPPSFRILLSHCGFVEVPERLAAV